MFKLTILFCNIFLASCGMNNNDHTSTNISRPNFQDDSQFAQYKTAFESIIKFETNNSQFIIGDIPIVMVDETLMDNADTIGVCYKYIDGKRAIKIKLSFWKNASEYSRQILINHELGHCRLDRIHNDEVHNGVKLSIMHSKLLHEIYYVNYGAFYHNELVTGNVGTFRNYLNSLTISVK